MSLGRWPTGPMSRVTRSARTRMALPVRGADAEGKQAQRRVAGKLSHRRSGWSGPRQIREHPETVWLALARRALHGHAPRHILSRLPILEKAAIPRKESSGVPDALEGGYFTTPSLATEPSAERMIDVPGSQLTERQAPPSGGSISSVEPKKKYRKTSDEHGRPALPRSRPKQEYMQAPTYLSTPNRCPTSPCLPIAMIAILFGQVVKRVFWRL
jgi:hypothetical protein